MVDNCWEYLVVPKMAERIRSFVTSCHLSGYEKVFDSRRVQNCSKLTSLGRLYEYNSVVISDVLSTTSRSRSDPCRVVTARRRVYCRIVEINSKKGVESTRWCHSPVRWPLSNLKSGNGSVTYHVWNINKMWACRSNSTFSKVLGHFEDLVLQYFCN